MRITPELIQTCPQFLNTINERELDLRGNKIAIIENIGATKDHFDLIDFSDNEISRLENFPHLKRLHTLFFNNNRLNYIDEKLGENNLSELETLILTNNYFRELYELNGLKSFKKLKTLSLLDNLVTKKENYRCYCIFLCPSLKILDFVKIKKMERDRALQLFGTLNHPSEEAVQLLNKSNVTLLTGTSGATTSGVTGPVSGGVEEKKTVVSSLTPEEIRSIKMAIANATTLQEIEYYNDALRHGRLPKELLK